MTYKLLIFSTIFFFLFACQDKHPTIQEPSKETFKVMAWNILHGGNDIPKGPEKVIDIIREVDPDIVLMVETYGSGKRIADSLGFEFHLIAEEGTPLDDKSVNLAIYSKYPFGERIDTDSPFYLGGREIFIGDRKIRCFSNWFHYLPWENEPEKMGKSVEELLEWERTETRFNMIQKVLPYLERYTAEADSVPMIFGGDMNSPSHLDWSKETKDMHNGLIVPWYSTKVLEDIGLIDSYREVNPDPISHPGITWDVKERRDEHRIDYIYYKGSALKAISSKSDHAHLGEPLQLNGKEIPYPSDHGFVVTVFELEE